MAHPKNEAGIYDEEVTEGELTMTVKDAVNLINPSMSNEELASISIEDLVRSVSYNHKFAEWDLLINQYCSILSSGHIFIDELQFR